MDGASRRIEPPIGKGMKHVSSEELLAWLEQNYCYQAKWTHNGSFLDIHIQMWARRD